MQNSRPGIGLVNNVIPEIPAQLLINPLSLIIYLGIIYGR